MSFSLDTNILLYASDKSSLYYDQAKSFVETCMTGQQVFYLAWSTVMSYLRISTHPSIFNRPLTPDEAMRNVETLMHLPHVRFLSEEEGFWEGYRSAASTVPTRGNLVPDTHLAALLRQYGIKTLYTRDRDFLKYPFLEVIDPFITP
jgi:toxin-antitoxin system PIN domain toxin